MAQRAEGVFVLHGRKAALREKPYEFLSNTQKTTSTHNLSFQGSVNNRSSLSSQGGGLVYPDEPNGNTLSSYTKENVTIDDLEENLRKLRVQVDSLASSLSFESKRSSTNNHAWPKKMEDSLYNSSPDLGTESHWSLASNHVNDPHEMFSAVQSSGLPAFSKYSITRPRDVLNSKSSSLNQSDFTYGESIPVKLGAPHIVGVKALLPPKIAVRSRSPERPRVSTLRGRSQSLDRSHSFSPTSKKARWLRSRSQSPKPIWRPNSAKANACAQPPPRLKSSVKTSSSNRQSRSRFYRPGTFLTRSFTPPRKIRSSLNYSWSPYSVPSPAISAPTAEEISDRFLKTLSKADAGISVVEASPYQQELTRLRLERLHVEEELLLEIKRQQELERTRGPKPKWYEMKNSQFHYEARKNNELLKTSKDYQAIFNYRQDLGASSKDFQEHFQITHLEPV
ncbi:uncharacterized protein [Dendrobates tinctorius]|uniref:uncharacterized protein n=1 Tax=Dendrobates tinctorius TaxID=92724 RepID=UPI003CCA2A29